MAGSTGRLERLASVLVDYSTRVGPGDLVCIDTGPAAARSSTSSGGGCRGRRPPAPAPRRRGRPELLLREGTDAQLGWISPLRRAEVERGRSHRHRGRREHARQQPASSPSARRNAERPASRCGGSTSRKRGDLRARRHPLSDRAAAQDADMSLPEYEDFVSGRASSTATTSGRVGASGRVRAARRVARRAQGDPAVGDGTDDAGRRRPHVDPATGARTSPTERSSRGRSRRRSTASSASAYRRLCRAAGQRGRARVPRRRGRPGAATKGTPSCSEMLALDEGARRAGEFSFGLNER